MSQIDSGDRGLTNLNPEELEALTDAEQRLDPKAKGPFLESGIAEMARRIVDDLNTGKDGRYWERD